MQALLRLVNIVLGPVLTLLFSSRFAGIMIAGKAAGDVLAGIAAGSIVLLVELALTRGPKLNAVLRRWLDPRAALEGFWLQEVYEGQKPNVLGCFSFAYDRRSDSFSVTGNAYSKDGSRWARWKSTQLFLPQGKRKVLYLWEGEAQSGLESRNQNKGGLTTLGLRDSGSFSMAMRGEGAVSHLGETDQVKFDLRRVTDSFLFGLGLSFGVRELLINENDEEAALVRAVLEAHPPARLSIALGA